MSNLHSDRVAIPADAWMRWYDLARRLSNDFFPILLELREARRRPSRDMLRRVAKSVQWAARDAPGIAQRNAAKQLLAELEAAAKS